MTKKDNILLPVCRAVIAYWEAIAVDTFLTPGEEKLLERMRKAVTAAEEEISVDEEEKA